MSRPEFGSGFADEINKYIDHKVANGYKEKSFTILLRDFDRFLYISAEKISPHGQLDHPSREK